jgi:hypothetical protein
MACPERLGEITPIRVTEALAGLARELGCDRPQFLPVMVADGAYPDTCVRNVRNSVRRWGGELRFGWIFSECPDLWISARFHAVRMTAGGLFVDETPDDVADGCRWALFAPDPQCGQDYSFEEPRPNQRRRTYEPKGCDRDYHGTPTSILTTAAQPSVRQHRYPNQDPLPNAIDDYIDTLNELDSLYMPTEWGRYCSAPEQISQRFV